MAEIVKGINIQIGAETTAFKKGLAELNRSSNSLQSELSAVNKGLKFDPKSTELLRQKQELLTKSVEDTKKKLETLKQAKEKADLDMANGTKVNENQYRELERAISATSTKLDGLENQSKEFGSVSKQQLINTGNRFEELGGKVEGVGKKISLGITAPIAAIGTASMLAFDEVDTALDTIVTKTGATGDAADDLNKSFNEVYKTLPVDAQEAGDAIGEVNTQFALTGENLEKASEQILKFSKINGQDVTSSTTSSKAAMEAFNLSADDLNSTLDAITKTAQNTGVGTDKLFDSVTKGAPQLKELGLDFAQSTEVMGRFEQSGIDSSKALGYLSKAQVTFAKDGKSLSDGLESLIQKIQNSSSQTESLTLASEYFGTKGATFMLDAIQRGALNFENFSGAAEAAAGSVSGTFEGTLDPIDGFTVAMNNLKLVGSDIASSLQETLLPVVQSITEKLQAFSGWFNNLSPIMQGTIVKIGLVAAAIGPLIVVIGTVISSVQTILAIAPLLTAAIGGVKIAIAAIGGPITIVMALIGVLIAKFVHAYNTSEEFRNKVDSAFNKIKEIVSNVVTAVKEKIKEFIDVGKNVIEGLWNGITDKVDWLKGKVSGVVDKIKGWFTSKDGFDTHSPSKWSEKIGDWVMQGLGIGMKNDTTAIAAARSATAKVGDAIEKEIESINSKIKKMQSDDAEERAAEELKQYQTNLSKKTEELKKAEKKDRQSILDEIAKLESDWNKKQKEASRTAEQEKLQAKLSELQKFKSDYETELSNIENKQNSMMEKLSGYGDLFEKVKTEDGKELFKLGDIKEEIKKIDEFSETIKKLKENGVNSGILAEIENMNIDDAIGYGQKLLEMDSASFEEYNALWAEKQQKAKEIASDLYSSELELLSKDFNGKLDSELGVLKQTTFATGSDSIQSLIDGMNSQENAAITAAKSLGSRIASALKSAKSSEDDVDGSHRTGLSYVPFDGYRAIVHQGEAILAAEDAKKWRSGITNTTNKQGDININVAKVVNGSDRDINDFMRGAEFIRRSRAAAVGGV